MREGPESKCLDRGDMAGSNSWKQVTREQPGGEEAAGLHLALSFRQ